MGGRIMKGQVMAFNKGKPIGIFDNATQASKALKMSKTTVALLIRNGKETKQGLAFDYCLWD
jgi:hypothetical protein